MSRHTLDNIVTRDTFNSDYEFFESDIDLDDSDIDRDFVPKCI